MAEQSALQEFLETLANDSSLQQQLKTSTEGLSNEETYDEVVRFAAAQGFEVSASDVEMLRTAAAEQTDELSDEQLDRVAGGFFPQVPIFGLINHFEKWLFGESGAGSFSNNE